MFKKHEFFMNEALKEAKKAIEHDDVPVGAVLVYKDRIISRACNQVELLRDPTAHAEMIAITQGCNSLGSKWLQGATLYVTIEPCSMCAGALVLARISAVVFGASDPKTGACGSIINIVDNKKLNHRLKFLGGVLEEDCALMLTSFFRRQRTKQAAANN